MSENEPKRSHYHVTPDYVAECRDLEDGAIVLYGYLTSLSHSEGYCWASNQYLAERRNVGHRTIQRWLDSLIKNNFIIVELDTSSFQTRRKIWISEGVKNIYTARQKCHPPTTKMSPPPVKNVTPILKLNTPSKEGEIGGDPHPPLSPSLSSKRKPRKQVIEDKQEVAERVLLAPSQQENLMKRAGGDTALLKSWYDRLSTWKVSKEIFDGKGDYAAIVNWVIDAVKKDSSSKGASQESRAAADEKLTLEIKKRFPQSFAFGSGNMDSGSNYIEFRSNANNGGLHFKFGEAGFREKVINQLRKMKLDIGGL